MYLYMAIAIALFLGGYAAFFLLYQKELPKRLGVFTAILLLSNVFAFLSMSERSIRNLCLLVAFDGLASSFLWAFGNRSLRNWQRTLHFALWILIAIFFSRLWFLRQTGVLTYDNLLTSAVVNFMESLRYFTLDGEYATILQSGLSGGGAPLYYALTACLVVLAPLTSATFLFEAATKLFAKAKAGRKRGKKKYIFSELNEEAIALAKSIYAAHRKEKQPCSILFADAYRLDDERWQALRGKAREIGAVCLEDGVSDFRYRVDKKGELVYFLINHDEWSNLDLLLLLTRDTDEDMRRYWASAKQVSLYVFSHNAEADVIAKDLYKKAEKASGGAPNLVIKVIRDATSLAYKLLQDKPLYLPLESAEAGAVEDRISLAILGSGKIGREFLATAYWCGQMLNRQGKKMPFKISVFSADAKAFEEKIRFEMPEIFLGGRTRKGINGDWNYCSLSFHEAEFGTKAFETAFNRNCKDCTYALVAMGDDELNFRAATWLNRLLDKTYGGSDVRPVVNFVLESEEFCALLKTRYQSEGKEVEGDVRQCIMNPFGHLAERYDFTQNIQRSDLEDLGWQMNLSYNRNRHLYPLPDGAEDERIAHEIGYVYPAKQTLQKVEKTFDGPTKSYLSDGYSRRSSTASALHGGYKRFARSGGGRVDEIAMTGIEHCRWNSFTRTNGYRAPTAQEFLDFCKEGDGFKTRSHPQKIHACLVDCDYAKYTLNVKLWAYFFLVTEKKTVFVYPEVPKKAKGSVKAFCEEWRKDFRRLNAKTLKAYPLLDGAFARFDALDDLVFFCLAVRMQNYQNSPTEENLKELRKCADTKVNDRNAVRSALS